MTILSVSRLWFSATHMVTELTYMVTVLTQHNISSTIKCKKQYKAIVYIRQC